MKHLQRADQNWSHIVLLIFFVDEVRDLDELLQQLHTLVEAVDNGHLHRRGCVPGTTVLRSRLFVLRKLLLPTGSLHHAEIVHVALPAVSQLIIPPNDDDSLE